jgi:peptide/nickel transport system ATP-binding protein
MLKGTDEMDQPIIAIRGLTVALPKGSDRAAAVTDLSFTLVSGEVVCVVGESGSGKSMTAQALMGLLPTTTNVTAGEILFKGRDILRQTETEWRDLRGRAIAMIFQEPMSALNPVMRIGDQIAEVFEAHGRLTPAERRSAVISLAREVGLPDPEKIVRSYPHQLSGGQRQRAMIAMALALEPAVLIADEPTTALDVTTQAQILALIKELQQKRSMAVLFITHDLGVVHDIADRVVVMRKGEIVERGSAKEVLGNPKHPYTRALLAAVPSLTPPPMKAIIEGAPALKVAHLMKTYGAVRGISGERRSVVAANDISFQIGRGETLGLVGESGSGKSTVARLAVRLAEPDGGEIHVGTLDYRSLSPSALRAGRRRIQMIFQDPFSSLNPRRKIVDIIASGPIAHGVPPKEARQKALEMLGLVGLDPSAADRYANAFSGGQRQRIGIARALALEPDVIVADEAVSALDVSIQAQILELLDDLKNRLGLAMLFITHDLRIAAQICDRVAVMQRGEIVEMKSATDLFSNPLHPYTQRLIAAIPGQARL